VSCWFREAFEGSSRPYSIVHLGIVTEKQFQSLGLRKTVLAFVGKNNYLFYPRSENMEKLYFFEDVSIFL
jgi:outer membrane protein assembly factor BamB